MLLMIVKMSSIVAGHVLLTLILWRHFNNKEMNVTRRILIGLIFGLCGILSNHFNINYGHSLLNIRDLSPLTAGLFFDPVSGVIAGLLAGIERYIIGTYFGIGSYTRLACSISTCLAGFLSAFLTIYVFKRKKPSVMYAFFMGAVMEVFHMYMVFATHRNDLHTALSIVKNHSGPMIFFTALGLMLESLVLLIYSGEWVNPFVKQPRRRIEVAKRFRFWMFIVISVGLSANFLFSYMMQSQVAVENADTLITSAVLDIKDQYNRTTSRNLDAIGNMEFHVGDNGSFDIISYETRYIAGPHRPLLVPVYIKDMLSSQKMGEFFTFEYYGVISRCILEKLDSNVILMVSLPESEIYDARDTFAYQTIFSNIIMMALIYILLSMLVQEIVVDNLEAVNTSLNKITDGNLGEEVCVYESSEFASLSDDINKMVIALKGYIDAAEKKVEQELHFAASVQDSALPKNFTFERNDFDIYASMNPAKQVGGDFYDFFFTGPDKLALVIADVSGKGIPAALFMMRSKTAIRTVAEQGLSPTQTLEKANQALCEGNKGKMFVTAWLGIIDLKTGVMRCANAGHEYPMVRRNGRGFEIYEDPHTPVLGLKKTLNFKEYEIKLEKGDTLFVYTDGIPESVNEKGEMFGTDRLKGALNLHKDASVQEMLDGLMTDIKAFGQNAEQFDDITMLGFVYNGFYERRRQNEKH